MWKDPKIEEPPKDRPFLAKTKNYCVILIWGPRGYHVSCNGDLFDFKEIEKWCEIPGSD